MKRSVNINGKIRVQLKLPSRTLFFALSLFPTEVFAQPEKNHGFDIEVDPIAFALNGFSLHGGYLTGAWRFDLGVFGLDVPKWAHGNEGFEARAIGAGWKADRFFRKAPDGFFVGVEGNVTKTTITHTASAGKKDVMEYSLGIRGGYRWNTGLANLYVTPWLGLGYILNAKDRTINGEVYKTGPFQSFPTVHIGWKF
ncbi:hypothetical protein [Parapedobacter composti]|uniref:hypothetical protein n=1 Tax=Parapedobacter composti TaxID=623281 RepID=UPI0037CBEDF9